jgi:hypothetical protein
MDWLPISKEDKKEMKKEKKCHEIGITLFVIPHWWDKQISTLKVTIHKQKPGLVNDVPLGVYPIPEINPVPKPDEVPLIQGICEKLNSLFSFYLHNSIPAISVTHHFQVHRAGKLMHPREMKKNDEHKVYVTEKIFILLVVFVKVNKSKFRMISEKFDGMRAYLQY